MKRASKTSDNTSSVENTPGKKRLRKDDEIYLVGYISHQILGAKLPSNRQVLSVLFYHTRILKRNTSESTKLVAEEVAIFYNKARIPIPTLHNCALKVERLYKEWTELHKNAHIKQTALVLQRINNFTEKLDNLFDMSHTDALDMIKDEDTRSFLVQQRQSGRPGCLLGVDQLTINAEQRRELRLEQEEMRRQKAIRESNKNGNENMSLISNVNEFVLNKNINFSESVQYGIKL